MYMLARPHRADGIGNTRWKQPLELECLRRILNYAVATGRAV
jgi:hypothetical protein